jgi:hypothetical protein
LIVDEPIASGAFTPYGDSAKSSERDLAGIELARQMLERWPELEPTKRRSLARTLLKRIDAAGGEGVDALSEQELKDRLTQAAITGAAG